MYGTSLRNKDRYRNGTKIHTKWARNGTMPDENSMASRQPALRGGKIHTKWGRNAIQNGKGLRRTLQCRKKIDTKMGEGQYEKGTIWEKARQRTALQGQGPYKSGTIRKGIRQQTARYSVRHHSRVSSIQNGAEVPYTNGREPDYCRIRIEDRYKNGTKIDTKWERYEKKSGSRAHGIPAGAQAAASSIQNGAEVPYEKGMEMGKRCEAKQDRYRNGRKIDTKVARKGMRP